MTSQGTGFLETLKKSPTNLFENNLNNTRKNMKSEIKQQEWWNCVITNTNLFPKQSFSRGIKNFIGQKNYG